MTPDTVPIRPLCEWLAGYAMPPRYTLDSNNPTPNELVDSWEKAIHDLIESGLMDGQREAAPWQD